MFRAIISPTPGALDCVHSLWCKARTMLPAGEQNEVNFHLILFTSRQHRPCFTPQAVKTV